MASGGTRVLKVVIAGDAKGAIGAFDAVAQKGMSFGKTLTGLAAGVSFAATAREVYRLGSSLESNLNLLQTLDKSLDFASTNASIKAASGDLIKLGFTGGDASAAMVELSKAGLTAGQVMASYKDTLVLARAGQLEVADAATAVSNTLNVFQGRGLTAAKVSNILANAANLSSANVGNLLESLQMGGNVAASAGMSFQQTAAALAVLANNGVKGSDAGTSLKTMLLRLTTNIGGSQRAAEKLGVTIYDSTGKMRPMGDVLKDLSLQLAGLTEKGRSDALYDIFGSDAIRAGKVLLKDGTAAFADLTARVDEAGKAQSVAEARTKGFVGAVAKIKALAQTTGEQLYVSMLPALTAMANGLLNVGAKAVPMFQKAVKAATPFLKEFASQAGTAIKGFITDWQNSQGAAGSIRQTLENLGTVLLRIGAFALSLRPVVMGLVAVMVALGAVALWIAQKASAFLAWLTGASGGAVALRSVLVGLLAGFLALQAITGVLAVMAMASRAFAAVKMAITAVRVAFMFLNMAIALNPFVAIAIALVAVGAGLVYAYKHSERFRSIVNSIGTVFKRIGAAIGAILAGIATGVIMLAKLMLNAFLLQFTLITQGAAKAFGWIPGIGGKIKAAAEKFSEFKSKANDALDSASAHAQGLAQNLAAVAQDRTARVTIEVQTLNIKGPSVTQEQADEMKAQRQARAKAGQAAGAAAYVPREVAPKINVPKVDLPDWGGGMGSGGYTSGGDGAARKGKTAAQKAADAAKRLAAAKAAEAKRFAQEIGRWTLKGFLSGITSSQAALQRAAYGLSNLINNLKFASPAGKAQAQKVLAASTARLRVLVDQRTKVVRALRAAESRLASLVGARSAVVQSVKDKMTEMNDITKAFSADEGANNSPTAVLQRFMDQAKAAKAFGDQIRQLAAAGLNSTNLQQIIDAGVTGGSGIAGALLAGGPGVIAQVNSITSDLQTQAQTLGTQVGDQMYKAGIDAAAGLVKGLQSQQSQIEALMLKIATSMTASIKKALGIKSPSRVMMGVGDFTAQGLSKGITDGIPGVQKAMDAIGAVTPSQGALDASLGLSGGSGSGGGDINVYVTVQGTVQSEKDLVKAIREGIREAQRKAGKPVTV